MMFYTIFLYFVESLKLLLKKHRVYQYFMLFMFVINLPLLSSAGVLPHLIYTEINLSKSKNLESISKFRL